MYKSSFLIISLLFTVSCAVGPDYVEPDVSNLAKLNNPDTAQYSTNGQVLHEWWKNFNDDELSKLVDDAFKANHDVRIAVARLMEARARRSEVGFDQFPTIRSGLDYVAAESSISNPNFADFPGIQRRTELYQASLDVTWELDFFGRVRRSVEAQDAALESSEASLRDALVLVAADVGTSYFQLRGAQSQRNVARNNSQNQSDSARITQALLNAGSGTELDTARAQAQLNVTLASVPQFDQQVATNIYRLSVLTGRAPVDLEQELQGDQPIPTAPQIVNIGSVSDLLKRRPDIVAAERNLAESSAMIGVAVADYFPRVDFVGTGGVQVASPNDLGNKGIGFYQLGPQITWAAFDLGRVHAQVKQTDARFDQSLAMYEKTVLTALEELQGALIQYQKFQEATGYYKTAATQSAKAADLAHAQYKDGAIDFLTVLEADRTKLDAEDRLHSSETSTAVALVRVYKALGGGWMKDEAAPAPKV